MIKASTLIFFLILINTVIVSGQANWKPGYIITASADTVYGEINDRSFSENKWTCEFRSAGKLEQFIPGEITGYVITGERHFVSLNDYYIFGEILVSGEMSLFKLENMHHLVLKDEQYTPLKRKRKELDYDGLDINSNDSRWKDVWVALVSDCLEYDDDALDELDYDEIHLTQYVIHYNVCRGAAYVPYLRDKQRTKIRIGAIGGMVYNRIKMNQVPTNLYYVSESYTGTNLFAGASIQAFTPRLSNTFYFQLDLLFMQTRISGFEYFDRSPAEYHDVFIELTSLSTPISGVIMVPMDRYRLDFRAGLQFDFFFEARSTHYGEQYVGTRVFSSEVGDPLMFKKTWLEQFVGSA